MNATDTDTNILERAEAALNAVSRIDVRTTPVTVYFYDGVPRPAWPPVPVDAVQP